VETFSQHIVLRQSENSVYSEKVSSLKSAHILSQLPLTILLSTLQ